MHDFLFSTLVIIFIPTSILLLIGIVNFFRAEQHTLLHGKNRFSTVGRLLFGEGYNAQGMTYHKTSITYIKCVGIGMAFFLLNFLLLLYFAPNSPL